MKNSPKSHGADEFPVRRAPRAHRRRAAATVSRRRFLGASAGIVAGAALGAGLLEFQRRPPAKSSRSHYPAIVVGSGYGGGVSALRLGQAGTQTLILEKGRLWDTPDEDGRRFTRMLPADTRAGWFTDVPPSLVPSYMGISVDQVAQNNPSPQPVQAGICDKSVHGAHSVFRGIAVGGGSMINAAIAAVPTAAQVRAAFPDIDADRIPRHLHRARHRHAADQPSRYGLVRADALLPICPGGPPVRAGRGIRPSTTTPARIRSST